MATPVNRTTSASTMMSAAPRSREGTALGSQFILQALEIVVAIVDSNRLGCFWWNGVIPRASAPRGHDRFYSGFPVGFHITNCVWSTNAPARRRPEVRQVGGDIKNPIRGSGIYQRATCRIYYSNRHRNCLYVRKADVYWSGE